MEFNEVENLSDTQIMELYSEVVDGPSNLLAYYFAEYCGSNGYVHQDINENGVAYGRDTGIPCVFGGYTPSSDYYFCDSHYGTIFRNVNENGVAYSYNTGTHCSAGVK